MIFIYPLLPMTLEGNLNDELNDEFVSVFPGRDASGRSRVRRWTFAVPHRRRVAVSGHASARQPTGAYQPLSFDEDWRFLQNPTDHDLFDPIKYIPLGTPDLTLSFGGSTRIRYEDKINAAFGGTTATAPTKDDDYYLSRAYLHTDLRYLDYARVYAEGVFAYIDGNARNPAPTPNPSDTADLHQFFLDLSPFNYAKDGFGLTLRLGCQELLFDKQKLVGPLDWANVRRTWDGGSVLMQWEQYQAEVFCRSPGGG